MRRGTASHLHLLRPGKAGETVGFGGGHTVSDLSASGPYLDDLFLQVLELDPADRSAAVIALCEGDEELEAELRALLEADTPEPGSTKPGRLAAGQPLDRYRLFKKLGRGASASVWQAWDTHLRTWTALKVLKPSLVATRQDALDVVLHEARAASQIISDHVVRVREAGRLDDGTCFVDMQLCAEYRPDASGQEELVVGHPLSDEVGALEPLEAARVMAEAARGVDAAHRVGVLHRDLKPANLLVQPVSRRVLVTDFGLALAQVAPAAGPGNRGTETVSVACDGPAGRVVGTPAWMAPEQARGEPPTRASDVYGLGATLYTMLTGAPPYRPREPKGMGGTMDVLLQVRGGPPPPLEGPTRLVRIVERAMAREPARRYPTAGALAADLERFVGGFPTSNDGPRPMLRMVLAARRNKETAATLAILAVALAVFAGFVQQLELRRQSLMLEVEAAEAHRVEAVAAEAAAVAAQRSAEAERLNAETARADAEAEADHARRVQQSAERQKAAAERARQAAEAGQSAAEQLAASELRARQDAEQEKALAHAARLDTQQRLEGLATQLAEAEAGRARAEAQVQAADTVRRELEQRLSDEVGLRIGAETARAIAENERDVARAELAARAAAERAEAVEAAETTPPSGGVP
ncbi:MAG TPA: hypothetical protein DFR83_00330 [Deltaproteobacteria bacterium]|nr:hypothetical protein [Deltaproteobacteria bacterium]